MKQGRASRDVNESSKREPKSNGINPHYPAQIGNQNVRTRSQTLYEGRGIEAPKVSQKNSKSGSQGKY